MIVFLLAYILIYGSMQVVFYLRIQALVPQGVWLRSLVCLFLALMIVAPILARLLEANGMIALATGLAWVGYTWMGFVFLAFCLSLLLFAVDGGLVLTGKLAGLTIRRLPARLTALCLLLACLGLSLYGVYESNQLKVERLRIRTEKLPSGTGLTVVQISDLHLGLILRQESVEWMIEQVRDIGPDLLVCTGDLIDGNLERLNRLAPAFASIIPDKGGFAVSGNHETYAGVKASFAFLEKAGFQGLRDEVRLVDPSVALVGMDYSREQRCDREQALLSSVASERYTVLLKHSPEVCPGSQGRFDLQLSGHTHNGQIFPFSLVVDLVYDYVSGLHFLEDGSQVYVSRGTGTWGPQMRILSPPELTVIEIQGRDGPTG
jgi:hypothetical protein